MAREAIAAVIAACAHSTIITARTAHSFEKCLAKLGSSNHHISPFSTAPVSAPKRPTLRALKGSHGIDTYRPPLAPPTRSLACILLLPTKSTHISFVVQPRRTRTLGVASTAAPTVCERPARYRLLRLARTGCHSKGASRLLLVAFASRLIVTRLAAWFTHHAARRRTPRPSAHVSFAR